MGVSFCGTMLDMPDETLSEKVNVRAAPSQLFRWMAAAKSARRRFADWVRVSLDDAAEREERQ